MWLGQVSQVNQTVLCLSDIAVTEICSRACEELFFNP
jgi:hypothetical protein